jgi:hypothetical protein
MADIAIDWTSADVSEGRLTVAFTEKPSKDWTERFQAVVDRLTQPGSGWDAVEIAKQKLHADAVQPGAEASLRHLLESALLQANADTDDGDGADDEDAENGRSERDQALTDTFRAFAES